MVVIWRLEYNRARFAWFHGAWDASEANANVSGEELKKRIHEILSGTIKLDYQATLVTLVPVLFSFVYFVCFYRSVLRKFFKSIFFGNILMGEKEERVAMGEEMICDVRIYGSTISGHFGFINSDVSVRVC